MHTETHGDTLRITGLDRLTSSNAQHFKKLTFALLTDSHQTVEVDLAQTKMLDSDGIGALFSVHKTMCARQGKLRLLRPIPFIHEMLELLRMDRIFEIVGSNAES